MAYSPQVWTNSPSTASPLSAARLNILEGGVGDASTRLDTIAATEAVGGVVPFSRYSPDTTGVASAAAKLQQALTELPDGWALDLGPAAYRYLIDSAVTVSGKTINMLGGATLVQGANVFMLTYTGTFSTPLTVTAVTATTRVFGDGAASQCTMLTAAGHDYTPGDVVKVVSDDLIVGSREANARLGEYAVVGAVVGNDVYLTALLRSHDGAYTTNVRVARHEPHTINLDGLRFTATADYVSGLVRIQGAFRPRLTNLTAHDVGDTFLTLTGCYAYRASDVEVRNLRNDPVNGYHGYGINDQNSEYGVVTGLHATAVRHGYTTGATDTTTNDARLYRYGRTAYFTVANSTAHGTSNSAFDTHEDAYGGLFIGCTARGIMDGNQSSGAGFCARGHRLRFVGCTTLDSYTGFVIPMDNVGGVSDIEFTDCQARGITNAVFSLSGTAARLPTVRVRGGRFDGSGKLVYAINGGIDLRNVGAVIGLNSVAADGVIRLDSGDVYLDEVRLDLTGTVTAAVHAFKVQDVANPTAGWSLKGRRVEITLPDTEITQLARGDSLDATGRLNLSDVRLSTTITTTVGLTNATILYTTEDTGATNNPIAYPTAYVRKTSTTTITANTTLASVSAFSLPMVASAIYRFEMQAVYSSPVAAALKLQLSVPSGSSATWSAVGPGSAYDRLSAVNTAVLDGAGATEKVGLLRGYVTVGATAGNLALLAAQNTSDAGNTVITTNTSMTLMRVG